MKKKKELTRKEFLSSCIRCSLLGVLLAAGGYVFFKQKKLKDACPITLKPVYITICKQCYSKKICLSFKNLEDSNEKTNEKKGTKKENKQA